MPVTEQIRGKLSQLPHKPGVYLMKDRFGTVIYVGKARDLRKRVSQYFHPSRRMGWELKFNALVEAIHDFDVHIVRSEPEAVLLEGKLIKEFQPRYNVSFRDDKRFLLLKVNLNDPIPRFTLTRLKTDDGARYFGPFASSGALRRTLNLVRHRFNLRGCRPLTPAQTDYKHCLYAHWKVSFRDGRPDRANYRRFRMKTVTGQNDFACMVGTVQRRYSRLLREARGQDRDDLLSWFPDLILIDGGNGQLGAACADLAKLGLSHLPIIGLAKEFEEIYRPDQGQPLRLGSDSGALKLLQRVRDESHRFANTYNARLRLKRISESVLDEFPGIGEQRKAALLKKFGSVHRLRLATVEEISRIPGFGGKAAGELKSFLEARGGLPAACGAAAE